MYMESALNRHIGHVVIVVTLIYDYNILFLFNLGCINSLLHKHTYHMYA